MRKLIENYSSGFTSKDSNSEGLGWGLLHVFFENPIETYLVDTVGLVLDYGKNVNIAIKWITWIFYVHKKITVHLKFTCTLSFSKCALCLKNVCACVPSHVQLFVTLWAIARQAPLSMVFSRQEYWSGSPFPSPRDRPTPWMEPAFPWLFTLEGRFFIAEPPGTYLK